MNPALWLVLALLVVAGLAFIYYTSAPPMPTAISSGTTASPNGPAAQSVTLPGGIISFRFPAAYGLAVSPEQVLVRSYIPPCDAPFDYCLYRTATDYASTTFESAGIRILARSDLKTEKACLTAKPTGFTSIRSTTASTTSYGAAAFGPLSGAAMGHYASGALYRLYASGTCTEFETRIGESQYANYPPGAIGQFTAADRAAVANELAGILGSVAASGTPISWPAAPATSTGR